jgi:hypothetical protein
MPRTANRFTLCGLAALMSLGAARSAAAQTTVQIANAPTAAPAKAVHRKGNKNPAPAAEAVWMPGFWDLRGEPRTAPHGGYVWVPGSWLTPPVPDARWDPGHWGLGRGLVPGCPRTGWCRAGAAIPRTCSPT